MAIGFGIIGCGMISQFHARAIAEVRGAKLVACCDTHSPAAEQFAELNHCTSYGDIDALLADPRVSIVTVATPSGAHLAPAIAAARAGKHVIVEKPLEITLKKCDRMIRECEQQGVQLATIFPSRFHDASLRLKRAIDEGRFGRLTLGDACVKWFRSQAYYDSGAWRGTWALDGGGALMNQAIHSVDLLTWLMGPVVEVQALAATLAHTRIEVEDTVVATLRFANGALGLLEATTAAYPGYLKRIEIHGSEGSALLEEDQFKAWDFVKQTKADRSAARAAKAPANAGGGAGDPAAIGHAGHARQFRDFLAAIRDGRRPAVDGHEGRRAVEIVLAVYKAAETGRTVKLPLRSDPILAARGARKKRGRS